MKRPTTMKRTGVILRPAKRMLRVYEGVGRGVPKERKRRYEHDAVAFLDERCLRGRSKDRR
ncbi:MAG: hypothetical protein ACRDTR_18655 [Rubrobacter sp.]